MDKKKGVNLSWDAFQAMGKPENAPREPEIKKENKKNSKREGRVRVYLEKKGRGGKTVSVIKGIEMNAADLQDFGKSLKARIGVGGSVKDGEIIIQGDQRKRILEILAKEGFSDCKNAGT